MEAPAISIEDFDRSSLTDKVYTLLKRRILSQTLTPGQKVDVDGLAADLGISRTPVKDALQRLASDGLVTVVARRGTFVARFDLQDLLELLDVRIALETHAVRGGAGDTSADQLDEIRALADGIERDFPDNHRVQVNYDEFLRRDRRFHHALVAMAANSRLLEMCDNLQVHIQMARAYYLRSDLEIERVLAEHRAIVEAVERREGEEAARAVRNHLERVKHSLRWGGGSTA